MWEATRVRVSGPLAGEAAGLLETLAVRGYGGRSAVEHVRRLARLSRWLEREQLDAMAVDEQLVEAMIAALHADGHGRALTVRSFRVVLGVLRSHGVVPPPTAMAVTPTTMLLDDYRGYLLVERGLMDSTVTGYLSTAAWFMTEVCGDDPARVAGLSAGDVSGFVLTVAQVRGPRSVNEAVVGVRSLLRYFHTTGLIDRPLAQATPWLARGRTSTLPRTLAAGTGELLVTSCDPDTLVGIRDRALITLLVRLGLRVGEVTAMQLGDIDWRRGEVMIRSKGGRRDPLPLPVDVGDSLACYLAHRGPAGEFREVFLHVRAPRRPMAMTGIRAVVRRACKRVGIADTSTHRLRHGAATAMLRNGAPLYEIGQVLRHRDIETTAMYAKVDFAALATVAQPWPERAS
ncbi:MAG: tyrosine-type recombinase/integrase [Ilumatobacteraceae bacterium]